MKKKIRTHLYQPKEITKKVWNNIMNSVKLQNRMDTTIMNSGNSKTWLLLKFSDKINLK